MHKLALIDNSGKEYIVKDHMQFYNHLVNHHSKNKIADHSVHEENGFYFTVTEDFFTKVEKFISNYNIVNN